MTKVELKVKCGHCESEDVNLEDSEVDSMDAMNSTDFFSCKCGWNTDVEVRFNRETKTYSIESKNYNVDEEAKD